MDLATLVHQYHDAFMARFGKTLLPDQRKALDAILRCRTPAAGELYVQCPDCQHGQMAPTILWQPPLPTLPKSPDQSLDRQTTRKAPACTLFHGDLHLALSAASVGLSSPESKQCPEKMGGPLRPYGHRRTCLEIPVEVFVPRRNRRKKHYCQHQWRSDLQVPGQFYRGNAEEDA